VLVHLARKAFLDDIPVPVVHIDTSYKFKEIYSFRDTQAKKWKLRLVIVKNDSALGEKMSPAKGRFECCSALKTEALKQALEEHDFSALLLAIRRDEHAIRAKERYFSPRDKEFKWDYQNQPLELWGACHKTATAALTHMRIHPLLHWREIDVWRYIQREKLPVVGLYFARKGKRFRSIGCESCCEPVLSAADSISKIIKEIESTTIAREADACKTKNRFS